MVDTQELQSNEIIVKHNCNKCRKLSVVYADKAARYKARQLSGWTKRAEWAESYAKVCKCSPDCQCVDCKQKRGEQ